MKKFIIQVVLLILITGVGVFLFSPKGSKINLPFVPQQPIFSNLEISGAVLKVELADTAAKRAKGLSGRQGLKESEGMLFVFEKADKHPFWMKGISFPLDFVWINGSKVVDILQNIQPPNPGQQDASLSIYSSKVETDKVLEVAAGTVEKLDIKVGDVIKLTP